MSSSSQTSVIFRYLDLLAESSVRIQVRCDEVENRLACTVDELAQSKRRSSEPNVLLNTAKNDLERSRQRCADLDRRLAGIQTELSQTQKRCDDLNRRLVATQNELIQSRSKASPEKSPKNDDSIKKVFGDGYDKSGRLCRYCGSTNLMFSNATNKPHYCYSCRKHL
jgi:septal ring factor EnvC (AmiA/AmiB activator)